MIMSANKKVVLLIKQARLPGQRVQLGEQIDGTVQLPLCRPENGDHLVEGETNALFGLQLRGAPVGNRNWASYSELQLKGT